MTEKSSFFDSIKSADGEYDREYSSSDFAAYFSSFIGNGVFPNPSTNLQVLANGNMTISIGAGKAFINGYYYENTEELNKEISTADGVLSRIDLIVVRLDMINREIKIAIKTGTVGSTPVAPELTRNTEIYELGIANIYITPGMTAITQAAIEDLRYNADYCGYVTGVVETIDTSTLLNQVTVWAEAKKNEYEQEFNTWFNNLKNTLDENAETNLANLIGINTNSINNIQEDISDLPDIRDSIKELKNKDVTTSNKERTSINFTGQFLKKWNNSTHNWYCIKNGWCFVQLDIYVTTNNLNAYGITKDLPKPIDDEEIWGILHGQGESMKNKSVGIFYRDNILRLDYSGGAGRYMGSFAYPIDE